MNPARRAFLKWAAATGSLLSAALVGVPSLRAFLSPAFRRPQGQRWIKLVEVDQMEPGAPVRFDFTETISDAWVEGRVQRGVWIVTEDGKDSRSTTATAPTSRAATDSTRRRGSSNALGLERSRTRTKRRFTALSGGGSHGR